MNKFYVVKIDDKLNIYNNWNECQEIINKSSCAVFKSFKIEEEAKNFLKNFSKVN